MKYCEYCGCASSIDKTKCESCGAPFTIHTVYKNTGNSHTSLNEFLTKYYDIPNAYEPINGLKPGRI